MIFKLGTRCEICVICQSNLDISTKFQLELEAQSLSLEFHGYNVYDDVSKKT